MPPTNPKSTPGLSQCRGRTEPRVSPVARSRLARNLVTAADEPPVGHRPFRAHPNASGGCRRSRRTPSMSRAELVHAQAYAFLACSSETCILMAQLGSLCVGSARPSARGHPGSTRARRPRGKAPEGSPNRWCTALGRGHASCSAKRAGHGLAVGGCGSQNSESVPAAQTAAPAHPANRLRSGMLAVMTAVPTGSRAELRPRDSRRPARACWTTFCRGPR